MTDPLTEARRLLFRADDILTGPDGASVWWAMQALADEVERLRALINKPKRDPLTDPRPGDVVRYDAPDMPAPIISRVTGRTASHVVVNSEHGELRYTIEHWADWSDITVEVLHAAPDEVTP